MLVYVLVSLSFPLYKDLLHIFYDTHTHDTLYLVAFFVYFPSTLNGYRLATSLPNRLQMFLLSPPDVVSFCA